MGIRADALTFPKAHERMTVIVTAPIVEWNMEKGYGFVQAGRLSMQGRSLVNWPDAGL